MRAHDITSTDGTNGLAAASTRASATGADGGLADTPFRASATSAGGRSVTAPPCALVELSRTSTNGLDTCMLRGSGIPTGHACKCPMIAFLGSTLFTDREVGSTEDIPRGFTFLADDGKGALSVNLF